VWDYVWATATIIFFSIPLALSVWALLDCARRPAWAGALAARRPLVWMATNRGGVLCVIPGRVFSLGYLLKVRPDLAAAAGGRFTM
jgi:hypothetical protein